MKKDGDKIGRVLSIYSRLKQGNIIKKEDESVKFNVAQRTIQRDIADIQCFLRDKHNKTDEMQEQDVVFDKDSGGYCLKTKI